MRIPLTVCGFHLQCADSAHSCGFRNSSIQLYTCLIICLWIPQTVLDSKNTVADFANLSVFGSVLSGTVFQVFVCGIQNSKEDQKSSNVADSATILILTCCGSRLQMQRMHSWAS